MTDKYSNLRTLLAALKLAGPVSTDASAWNAVSDALDVELVAELLAERDALVNQGHAMTDKTDHKAIREALARLDQEPLSMHGNMAAFNLACKPSAIRALLDDLDAMRGLLFGIRQQDYLDDTYRARIDAALKGATP